MTPLSMVPALSCQADETLRSLSEWYARRFQTMILSPDAPARDRVLWHAYERLRDVLGQASEQQQTLKRALPLRRLSSLGQERSTWYG